MDLIETLAPPPPQQRQGFAQMTRDQRAHACWLALRAGWQMIRSTWGVVPATGVVVVDLPRLGATCSRVHWPADETLARIADRFGVAVRERVEAAIG